MLIRDFLTTLIFIIASIENSKSTVIFNFIFQRLKFVFVQIEKKNIQRLFACLGHRNFGFGNKLVI